MLKRIGTILATVCSGTLFAATLEVQITTQSQDPLSQTVIYLETDEPVPAFSGDTPAIMDQIDRQFSPHVLAVQKGSSVVFPNSDSIKHHVYSFSPAKVFELQLYKGLKADPELFDKAGVVELGCNVHDWMLGYVFVADTPYFSVTDETGKVSIDAPDGNYRLKYWHPRMQDADINSVQAVDLKGNASIPVQLTMALLPSGNEFEDDDDEFSDYE